ncbi:FIST N-terminal domain-containing protein [Terasakiella sp. SH-1]|uniref:FIST signal transduction protein n=1 Tax=Terasakiella sp. SH-1 TaxID=2560057 RepID=UPI00142F9F85|nr:FIST N-terminal domain-containing protein [Terasakiella sp. SH-1]
MVKIATAGNTHSDTLKALESAVQELRRELGAKPKYVMVQMNAALDADLVRTYLHQMWPQCHVHGATSCLGTITDKGVMSAPDGGLALYGVADDESSYGVGFCDASLNMKQAAVDALHLALTQIDREGEMPDLVWTTCSPGSEEEALEGLQGVLGQDIPIIGGSCADNEIAGNWSLFNQHGGAQNGCVVTAIFSENAMGNSFQSAYIPTDTSATITSSDKRIVKELDHQLAGEVYARWTGIDLKAGREDSLNILGQTTLAPLGRRVGDLSGADMYLMSHPETITPEGYLTLFTDVEEGQIVTLMSGNKDMLLNRASRVCEFARNIADISTDQIAGSIIVYCAGCMLTVRDDLEELHKRITQTLGGKPFMTAFTFGEQGQVIAGENCHGNLMVSSLMWGQS